MDEFSQLQYKIKNLKKGDCYIILRENYIINIIFQERDCPENCGKIRYNKNIQFLQH